MRKNNPIDKEYSNEYYTPPEIIADLGPFQCDPCFPADPPASILAVAPPIRYTPDDDGLSKAWESMVWLNPPYSQKKLWLIRGLEHGVSMICFLPANVETQWFFNLVWHRADAILFPLGRIDFIEKTGARKSNPGANVIAAYGADAAERLKNQTIFPRATLVIPGESRTVQPIQMTIFQKGT